MFFQYLAFSQTGIEKDAPFNIKTISFRVNGNNVIPFFKLGETFELSFDDLYGDEADYYYTITQYNYDCDGDGSYHYFDYCYCIMSHLQNL